MMEYKCVNCGRTVKRIPGRFPLCECGHTEIVDTQKGVYIETDFAGGTELALMSQNGYIEYLQKENPNTLLSKIVGQPVKNGRRIADGILKQCEKEEREFLKELPTWAVLAHAIEKEHSEQYRYVIDKKYYSFAYEILKSGKLLNMPQPEVFEGIDHLTEIWKDVPTGSALTVYEALLYRFSDEEACRLGASDICVDDFFELLQNTDFSREEIIAIAYSLGQLLYGKKEIIALIKDYNRAIRFISCCGADWKVHIVSDMDTEICRAVNKAKYYVRSNMQLQMRLQETYRLSEPQGAFYIENKGIRMSKASFYDACRFCATVPESDTIRDPAFVVSCKGSLMGILYIGEKDTHGVWFKPLTDNAKRGINAVLDIYTQSDACKQIRNKIGKSDKEKRL